MHGGLFVRDQAEPLNYKLSSGGADHHHLAATWLIDD